MYYRRTRRSTPNHMWVNHIILIHISEGRICDELMTLMWVLPRANNKITMTYLPDNVKRINDPKNKAEL